MQRSRVVRREVPSIFQIILVLLVLASTAQAFTSTEAGRTTKQTVVFSSPSSMTSVNSVEEASRILSEWDRIYNPESVGQSQDDDENGEALRKAIAPSVRLLSEVATEQRNKDSAQGRCMLGICAPTAQDGVNALKAWVTALELPRGLLHGMDKDGVPIDLSGSVYIKYNSGGVYTFADIRKSGLGFDALWKPGDALLEPYDGTYRGVYFQVELEDGEFRQYLVPLDTFELV